MSLPSVRGSARRDCKASSSELSNGKSFRVFAESGRRARLAGNYKESSGCRGRPKGRSPPMDGVLHYLRTLGAQGADRLDDGELLERFRARRDEAAFADLLQRDGPMVLGVGRRLLGEPADADDAFQATFLVLVRHARAVRKRASVASWLYGVAYRTALKARARRTAWRRRQRPAPTMQPQEPADDLVWRDLRPLLDEEVARLPDKYRAPLLLCDVEGLTYEEAARRLGCTRGALSARLTRARELLRGRLTRRGVTMTAAVLGAALGQHARAAVPAALATATLRAGSLTVAGQAAGVLPAEILSLTEEVVQAMKTRFTLALALLMALGIAAGAPALMWLAPGAKAPEGPPPVAPPRQAGVDLHGDALPKGAVARFGSPRFRHAGTVHALSFSGDGKVLASAGHDNAVRLWEAATGKELARRSGFKDAPEWATLSPDGKRLATASLPDGRLGGLRDVRLLDRATGKQIRGWVGGHTGRGTLAFAPDGKFLAVVSNGKLLLCEAGTGKEVRQIKCRDHVYPPVVFAGDGKTLAAPAVETDKDNPVATTRVWEVATGKERRRFPSGSTLALSPDGKRLAVGAGGTILLHDTVTGKQTLRLSWPRPQPGPDGLPDRPPEAGVTSVAFSPDGQQLAAGGDGPVVRVWEVATGKPVRQLPAYEAFYRDVAFSPDGQTLAATDGHGVRLWDPVTGKERLAAFGHWAAVEALVVSPDGKTVTSVDAEALLTWETATGRGLTRCDASRGRSLTTGLLLPVALAPGVRHFAVADA